MVMKRIIVVGGGASGMMAAIAAARNGASVTLLEAMERTGKKLLLTGNGRCNLTHMDDHPEFSCFGAETEFIRSVMQQFLPGKVRDFFEELGLLTMEKNGYVYPVTGQASSVHEVLMTELRRLKVKVKCSEKIAFIEKKADVWLVRTAAWQYECDALILACGSKAAPKTGSDGSGYTLAKMAGHRISPVFPALAPVICRESWLSLLAGVRCRAAVSLFAAEKGKTEKDTLVRRESGELQWTNYGVSGIVIFQLSRFIASCPAERTMYLEIDLLPDTTEEELAALLAKRALRLPRERVSVLLEGCFHEKLIPVLLQLAGVPKKLCCDNLSGPKGAALLEKLIHTAKHLLLTPAGTKSFDVCQVCQGGVDTSQVKMGSLESELASGLYFAGELLDVDGLCGGYNLQWAWASGCVAGRAASQKCSGGYHDQNT